MKADSIQVCERVEVLIAGMKTAFLYRCLIFCNAVNKSFLMNDDSEQSFSLGIW